MHSLVRSVGVWGRSGCLGCVRFLGTEADAFYEQHSVSIHGRDAPPPTLQFKDAALPDNILSSLHSNGMREPTPIQAVSLPIAMSGRDMVGIAQTGSGKTLSYVLPALSHVINKAAGSHCTQALVMAPTRELAQQIQTVARTFTGSSGLKTVAVYGGASVNRQAVDISRGMDMCIATPGRLLQFLENQTIQLSDCSYLVFDEADRMLDMGFEPQIREVMEYIKNQRQMLMWSATWPEEIKQLAGDFLDDYIEVHIGADELQASESVQQDIQLVTDHEKPKATAALLHELFDRKKAKVLIFTATKFDAENLSNSLRRNFRSDCIHGGKSQAFRDRVLSDFRSGRSHVLVATDVAARGLDVDDITHVINYDFPMCIEDYIHRIGRTGRWGKTGTATSFFTPDNYKLAKELVKVLQQSKQEVPEDLQDIAAVNYGGGKQSFRGRYNTGRNQYGSQRQNQYGSRNQYNSGRNQYNSGRNQYNSGRNQYGSDRRNQYDRGDDYSTANRYQQGDGNYY